MATSEPLFDAQPAQQLEPDQWVWVQLMEGQRRAVFRRYVHEDGYPMAEILIDGDVARVNVARVGSYA